MRHKLFHTLVITSAVPLLSSGDLDLWTRVWEMIPGKKSLLSSLNIFSEPRISGQGEGYGPCLLLVSEPLMSPQLDGSYGGQRQRGSLQAQELGDLL